MRFILVHGAWHYGELWKPVREHLEANGHEVHTPTAGGLGKGDDVNVDLRESAAPIIEYIKENNLTDYVLVAHSWGGYIISRIAIEMPERLRRLVYLAAFVPAHGSSLMEEIPPHIRTVLEASAEERMDGTIVLPFQVWREAFYGGGSAEEAKKIYDLLRPHPLRTFTDKADMNGWDAVPKAFSYIAPYEDNDITQGTWGRHPRLSNRLGMFRLVGMQGSHEVPLTDPKLTAQKLIEGGSD